MRSLIRRRAADVATVAFAGVLLNVAVFESLRDSTEKLALFAAVAIAAEALQRAHDELLPDALEGERFSLTSPIHLAAILVAGPWVATAVAGWSVLGVGLFRGVAPISLIRRAASLAAAALAGGVAFALAGGVLGELRLPEDLLPAALAGLVYVTVRTLLEGLATRRAALPDLIPSASAIGLGIVLAYAALQELWLAIALVPMLLLVERLYARVVALRWEMATALETFANIVDERHTSTHGHSLRVAGYVRDLAHGLGLSPAEVSRLWWAGRLHDLGKVAVDAAVLQKPGELDDSEWAAVRRAPRLSARLLQRFRFAARQAQAVEFHRERYDGSGYYGAARDNVPLAAHFLIVADAFDAMTTDRPFRKRLTREEALREIERGSGTQFHPMIAHAFVAVQRGQDPADVLPAEELAAIRDASVPAQPTLPSLAEASGRPELVALAGAGVLLVGLGTGIFVLAVAGAAVGLVGLKLWHVTRRRVQRLSAALHDTFEYAAHQAQIFGSFVDVVDKKQTWPLTYASFVEWREDGAGGSVAMERGDQRPPETSLVSWLLREAESGAEIAVDTGSELPGTGYAVALPLRRDNSALVGFIVLCGIEQPPRHVLPALESCLDALGLAFAEARPAVVLRAKRTTPAKRLDARRRPQARTLEA